MRLIEIDSMQYSHSSCNYEVKPVLINLDLICSLEAIPRDDIVIAPVGSSLKTMIKMVNGHYYYLTTNVSESLTILKSAQRIEP